MGKEKSKEGSSNSDRFDYKSVVDGAIISVTQGKFDSYKQLQDEILDLQKKKDELDGEILNLTAFLDGLEKQVSYKVQLDAMNEKIENNLKENMGALKMARLEGDIQQDPRLYMIEQRIQEGVSKEAQEELLIGKVKTGDMRLDDLLLGGIPLGSNVAIYGPPFTGKEITMNSFVVGGLRKNVPVICILTDKLVEEFKEELSFMLPDREIEVYEKYNLITYIDACSKSMGYEEKNSNAIVLDGLENTTELLGKISETVDSLTNRPAGYRLAFRGLSNLLSTAGVEEMSKFLNEFTKKRKMEMAVSMYSLEKGMHDEQDTQQIMTLMGGCIDYKVEQLKTYLCIKGICDVQSRAWLDYVHSNQELSIGSFSLDHIR